VEQVQAENHIVFAEPALMTVNLDGQSDRWSVRGWDVDDAGDLYCHLSGGKDIIYRSGIWRGANAHYLGEAKAT